jgi:hypothetical protein
VRDSGIQHGLCLVNPMHITAAVYVNDKEGRRSPSSSVRVRCARACTDGVQPVATARGKVGDLLGCLCPVWALKFLQIGYFS